MSVALAAVASIFLFAAFVVMGAWLGLLAGSLLVTLTITLIVLGASSLIAALLAVIFRICGGGYGG